MVYARCLACGVRREHCLNISAHKKEIRWTVDVEFEKGRRVRKSLPTKELAEMTERQWRTDFEREKLVPKREGATRAFEDVAREWLTMATNQKRINRNEQYRIEMFIKLFGRRQIGQLKYADGEAWLGDRIAKGIAINTVNRDMKPLKWVMDYAVKKGLLEKNPFTELKQLKGGNVRVRWLTQAEVDKLLETALARVEDGDLYDVVAVALNTGFRKGNLERLTARDVSNNLLTAVKTKSGNPYDVPITPAIAPVLQRLIQTRPTGPLLKTAKLDPRFRALARAAGLYTSDKDRDKVTLHTLRHTYAALYLKRGGDIYKLSKYLGHSSIAITEKVYAHLCPKDLAAQAPLLSTPLVERPHTESNRALRVENAPS